MCGGGGGGGGGRGGGGDIKSCVIQYRDLLS